MKTGIYWQDPKYAVGRCRNDPSCVLYLPLHRLDGASFMSKDAYGHLCTVTGAIWAPRGRDFDGSDDNIDCGNDASLNFGVDDFSIEFWIKTTTPNKLIGGKYQDGDNRWYIQTTANGMLFMFCEAGGVIYVLDITGLTDITDGEWHHIVIVGDRGNRGWIYLDGQDDTSATQTCLANDMDNTGNFFIGSYMSSYFPGTIGGVRVYNRALTPIEIQRNYLATKGRYR